MISYSAFLMKVCCWLMILMNWFITYLRLSCRWTSLISRNSCCIFLRAFAKELVDWSFWRRVRIWVWLRLLLLVRRSFLVQLVLEGVMVQLCWWLWQDLFCWESTLRIFWSLLAMREGLVFLESSSSLACWMRPEWEGLSFLRSQPEADWRWWQSSGKGQGMDGEPPPVSASLFFLSLGLRRTQLGMEQRFLWESLMFSLMCACRFLWLLCWRKELDFFMIQIAIQINDWEGSNAHYINEHSSLVPAIPSAGWVHPREGVRALAAPQPGVVLAGRVPDQGGLRQGELDRGGAGEAEDQGGGAGGQPVHREHPAGEPPRVVDHAQLRRTVRPSEGHPGRVHYHPRGVPQPGGGGLRPDPLRGLQERARGAVPGLRVGHPAVGRHAPAAVRQRGVQPGLPAGHRRRPAPVPEPAPDHRPRDLPRPRLHLRPLPQVHRPQHSPIPSTSSAETKEVLSQDAIMEQKGGYTWIKLPAVLQAAKEHFACQTLEGVPLEDDGSDGSKGSHWETSILQNDIMTAVSKRNTVITKITLKLLEGSGWYTIHADHFERTNWGQGTGCTFLTDQCNTHFAEYCQEEEANQMDFFMATYGQCQKEQFDDCHSVKGFQNIDCTRQPVIADDNQAQHSFNQDTYQIFGKDSIMLQSTIIKKSKANSYGSVEAFRCYKYQLKGDDEVTITLANDHSFDCTIGESVQLDEPEFSGTLVCPQEQIKTLYRSICHDQCSMAGYCYNGQCLCFRNAVALHQTCSCGEYCTKCVLNPSQQFECGTCQQGTVLTDQKQCEPNIDCTDKIALCKLCQSPTECHSCEDGSYLISDKKICEQDCPETGYYLDQPNKTCLKCIPFCQTCDLTQCKQCDTGYLMFKDECIEKEHCQGSVFQNTCLECHQNCNTCSGEKQNNCLSCKNGQILLTNTSTCHDKCPKQTIQEEKEDTGMECTICGYWIFENECFPECPDGSYQVEQTEDDLLDYGIKIDTETAYGKCERCVISFCKNCGKNKEECEECQDGYYGDNKSCDKCQEQCKTCENEMDCSSCEEGKQLVKLLEGQVICAKICEEHEQRNSKIRLECILCEIYDCKQCSDDGKSCVACNGSKKVSEGECVEEGSGGDNKEVENGEGDSPDSQTGSYVCLLEIVSLIFLIIH